MNKVSTMILAGGRGKRMGALCNGKPKPALPFAGNFRVIDFSLSNCINSKIKDIAVLTGYQRSYLSSYLKRWQSANMHDESLVALEPRNGSYLGTADAVYQNLEHITRKGADTALILAADHIYQMDYREMIAFHNKVGADVTVGVISVPIERASQFGTVKTDIDNKIVDFVEKPVRPQSNLVSMGIYVFRTKILRQRLIEDAAQADSVHDFGHVILPKMVNRDRVFAYQFSGYWQDIGTPEAYHQANLELTYPRSSFNMDENWPILTAEKYYEQYNSTADGRFKNCIVGKDCIIKGYVENSVLSPGVWVGEGAVVRDSVIMANVSIGRHTRVYKSILDEGVSIGEHCNIGDGLRSWGSEIIILEQDLKIPSHTAVGCGNNVLSGREPINSSRTGLTHLVVAAT